LTIQLDKGNFYNLQEILNNSRKCQSDKTLTS